MNNFFPKRRPIENDRRSVLVAMNMAYIPLPPLITYLRTILDSKALSLIIF